MMEPEQITCRRCGLRRDTHGDATQALAWIRERERGRTQWLCPRCARAHVRDIESKLPVELW